MIKQSFFILVLSMLFWACGGQADMEATASDFNDDVAVESMEEAETQPLLENPKIDKLNTAQRNAFEAKAVQKLQDFFDYIKIISDPNVNADLRSHSYNLALDLFVNDTTTVQDSLLKEGEPMLIRDYLSSIMIKKSKVAPKVQEVNIVTPINSDSTAIGSGQLRVIFSMKTQQLDKTIDIHLMELEKEFGDTNQKTIEVKLGNIY